MKITLGKKNYRQAFAEIRKKKPAKLSIHIKDSLFSLSNPIAVLKDIADFAIQEGVGLTIWDIPFCLMPGYKSYIKFDKKLRSKKSEICNGCQLFNECGGVGEKVSKLIINLINPITQAARGLTDLEKCMLKILSIENGISTERVLKLAEEIDICASCSSGGEVFRVADQLIKKKLIKREFKNGQYVWRLN